MLKIMMLFFSQMTFSMSNGMWVQTNYLRDYYLTDQPVLVKVNKEDIDFFIQNVRKSNSVYNYVFWSTFNSQGFLAKPLEQEKKSIKLRQLAQKNPGHHFIPWLGGVQNKNVFLHNEQWRKNAIEEIKRVVELTHSKYVHINIEYLLFDKEEDKSIKYFANYMRFLKAIKKSLPEVKLSIVTPPSIKSIKPFKYQHNYEELMQLLEVVDQINILYYDTKFKTQTDYLAGLSEQLLEIRKLKEKFRDKTFLVGVGSFVNAWTPARKYRNLVAEDLEKTLKKIIDFNHKNPNILEGVSIFCEWLTNEVDWNIYYKYLGKKN